MARYIDADKLKELVNGRSSHWLNEWDTLGVLAVIDETPTADVAEVKHGKWEHEYDDNGTRYHYCSQCTTETPVIWSCDNYCPACGAKMDSEEDN